MQASISQIGTQRSCTLFYLTCTTHNEFVHSAGQIDFRLGYENAKAAMFYLNSSF